jgi:hypothetical protein
MRAFISAGAACQARREPGRAWCAGRDRDLTAKTYYATLRYATLRYATLRRYGACQPYLFASYG